MSGPCKASLVKGRCRACEAEDSLVVHGCDGQLSKARCNPSVRLRRPPPSDKGGFVAHKTARSIAERAAKSPWFSSNQALA